MLPELRTEGEDFEIKIKVPMSDIQNYPKF